MEISVQGFVDGPHSRFNLCANLCFIQRKNHTNALFVCVFHFTSHALRLTASSYFPDYSSSSTQFFGVAVARWPHGRAHYMPSSLWVHYSKFQTSKHQIKCFNKKNNILTWPVCRHSSTWTSTICKQPTQVKNEIVRKKITKGGTALKRSKETEKKN